MMPEMLFHKISTCQEIKEKVWGREFWIVNNQDYCGKVLVLNRRSRCSIHCHHIKKETFFVISGKVLLETWSSEDSMTKHIMEPGSSITIVPYMLHRFTGLAPMSEIIEFSSQHFEHDSHRTTQSGVLSEKEWEALQNEL